MATIEENLIEYCKEIFLLTKNEFGVYNIFLLFIVSFSIPLIHLVSLAAPNEKAKKIYRNILTVMSIIWLVLFFSIFILFPCMYLAVS